MDDLPAGARERLAAVPMPKRIVSLPRDSRGYPVPAFVAWIDGVPDFRIIKPGFMAKCVKHPRCWICGDVLGSYKTFPVGCMCAINRTTPEPPSHRECALYAAKVCPFLAVPEMRRNPRGLEDAVPAGGFGLKRNPGVVCLWTTRSFTPFRAHAGQAGTLFQLGEPTEVLWMCRGRGATREEIEASVSSGYPSLMELAVAESPKAVVALEQMRDDALKYLPPSVAA